MSGIVYLITNNKGKLAAAQCALSRFGIEVRQFSGNFLEIQSDSSVEIAKFTALAVAKEKNLAVIREDHSLFINALKIPGPYTSFFERAIPAEKLLKILENFSDRGGYFEVATVFADPSGNYKEYAFKVPILFSTILKGNYSFGWNRIIILDGENRTLAEYKEEERLCVWGKNFESIGRDIENGIIKC